MPFFSSRVTSTPISTSTASSSANSMPSAMTDLPSEAPSDTTARTTSMIALILLQQGKGVEVRLDGLALIAGRQLAEQRGLATGFISNDAFTGATPAASRAARSA